MSASLLRAIECSLKLSRGSRESPINVGQLHLLAILDDTDGLNRYQIIEHDSHEQPTIDRRLCYLRRKGLVEPTVESHHHASSSHVPTRHGRVLCAKWRGNRSNKTLLMALDAIIALPINHREEPLNVGVLEILANVVAEPDITTDALLNRCRCSKQTLKSRLKLLAVKSLIEKHPRFNAGGTNSPNWYTATEHGELLIGGFVA